MKQHFLGIIGAGNRGKALARQILKNPDRAKITAVVETDDTQIKLFQKEFDLPREHCFKDYRELLKNNLKLDGVFVTTPPNSHADITCAYLEAGIPVFLEKPMAHNLKDAKRIVRVAQKTGTCLQVGFNLRYAPFFVKLKETVCSGQIGEIMSMEWKEILSPSHWATYCWHPSYNKRNVIGSWLLEKCCHDIDIMNWIIESPCIRVASFGSRSYFNPRSDVPQYCTDNCPLEKECLFSALNFFPELSDNSGKKLPKWKTHCVYNTDSDLVDRQTSILEYANGATVAFSLMPLGPEDNRVVRICGTEATLKGNVAKNEIRIFPYQSQEEIICDPGLSTEGHGGGDPLIIFAFLDWLDDPGKRPKNTEKEGWETMLIGCGIGTSLRKHEVVNLNRV